MPPEPDHFSASPTTSAIGGEDATLRAAILDSLGEAVIATDLEGRIVHWNRAAEHLYGWRANEVLGSNLLDLTPARELRSEAEAILNVLRRGDAWTGEVETLNRAGEAFPVVITSAPVRDAEGAMIGIVGVSRDISGQRRAESALEESRERLDLVRRAAPSVIWELDPATGRLEWSDALSDVFGYALDEVEPSLDWWRERIHPEDRARLERSFSAFLDDNRHFWTQEYRFQRADGSYAQVFDRAYASDRAKRKEGPIAGAMMDLSERRRMQDERRLLAQASMILDLSLDYEATLPTLARLVANTMADGCIIHLTPGPRRAAFTTAAHADAGLQGTLEELADTVPPTPPPGSFTERVMREREPVLLHNVPAHLEERDLPERVRALAERLDTRSAILLPIGARSAVFGFMVLAGNSRRPAYGEAELHMAEELARRIGTAVDHAQLYESEQLASRAKADFLAVMSHELRTPLTAVLGYADLLANEISGPLNDHQRRQVQRIRAGTDRLHRLLENILAYVRLETDGERTTPKTVEVNEILDRVLEVVKPRADEDGVHFQMVVGAIPDRIITDPDRVVQILLALLTNALKFDRRGQVELRVARNGPRLEMEVSDTGDGIPEVHQPHVFNAFWQVEQPATRRAGGAGLGLAVARRLARLLAGDVVLAESSPKGTTFRFWIPVDLTA